MKKAFITGVTGQDGSFLAEFLLEKGYEVHGMIRRSSTEYRERIDHIEKNPNFHLHYGHLGDSMSIIQIIRDVKPEEVYNLAAQSHVGVSFASAEYTADIDATGVLRVLEAIRQCGLADKCHFYQASTSELYGKVEEVPQNENTHFHPFSPYAVAKQYGFWITKEYREAYNMFCCNGILFNHESERRGETFVTRKITLAAARIAQGKQDCLYLGNLSSLREFTLLAFKHAGIELRFEGEGMDEKGIVVKGPEKLIGRTVVAVSEKFYRPTDVVNLWGDASKAKRQLGWDPAKQTSFEDLVRIMVESDIKKVSKE